MNVEISIKSKEGSDISLLINTVDRPKAQVVFAHGAGANMSHEFMEELTLLLNELNINVFRFNFPFMDKRELTGKKYPPDRMPKLLACYNSVLEFVISTSTDSPLPLFIGGKSMGSRVAATLMTASDELNCQLYSNVKGLFCLGYPFHPTKKTENLRLEPLLESNKEILIVQGERDTLGSKVEIESYHLPKHCQCCFLPDGDHSLKPRIKSGYNYTEHKKHAAESISRFIDSLLS